MSVEVSQILADSESFDLYCARVAGRLSAEWTERVQFFTRSTERLETLHRLAHAVHDADLERELSTRLEAARRELSALQTVALQVPARR
jgi:hypothetical protein